MKPDTRPLLLYDAACPMCTDAAAWAGRRGTIRTCPLGENDGKEALVLVEEGSTRRASSAALGVCRHLPWPWSILAALLVVPLPIRDAVYRFVARNRHRLVRKATRAPEGARNTDE